jgi:hypothetical protein
MGRHLMSGAAATALGWGNGGLHLPWLCIDTLTHLARPYRLEEAKARGLKPKQAAPAGLQHLREHFKLPSQGQAHRCEPLLTAADCGRHAQCART